MRSRSPRLAALASAKEHGEGEAERRLQQGGMRLVQGEAVRLQAHEQHRRQREMHLVRPARLHGERVVEQVLEQVLARVDALGVGFTWQTVYTCAVSSEGIGRARSACKARSGKSEGVQGTVGLGRGACLQGVLKHALPGRPERHQVPACQRVVEVRLHDTRAARWHHVSGSGQRLTRQLCTPWRPPGGPRAPRPAWLPGALPG